MLLKVNAFYHHLPKIHPIYANWMPSSVMKPPTCYTIICEKAPQKAGTCMYTMSMWELSQLITSCLFSKQLTIQDSHYDRFLSQSRSTFSENNLIGILTNWDKTETLLSRPLLSYLTFEIVYLVLETGEKCSKILYFKGPYADHILIPQGSTGSSTFFYIKWKPIFF